MQAPLAYWLTLVERLVHARTSRLLDEHGVTRMQWRMLNVLESDGATLDELERVTEDVTPVDEEETVADALAELGESGWIVGDADGYRLTPRGSDAVGHLAAAVTELRGTVLADITPADEATTIAVLERMARNLGWDG